MDFDKAIVAHTDWKSRFRNHLKGREVLVAEVVGRDDQCELGKWIRGEGKKYEGRPEFEAAKKKHTVFHSVAGAVVRKSKTLPPDQSQMLVSITSDYGTASGDCVASLVALRDAVQRKK